MRIEFYRRQEGQIALIFLLISAIAMTLGLSVSRKETTETKINTVEEKQKEAFNTAESGINYYLGTGGLTYKSGSNTANVENIEIKDSGVGAEHVLDFGEYVLENNPVYFWLVNHGVDGSIQWDTHYEGNILKICNNNTDQVNFKVDYFYRMSEVGEFKVNHSYFGINGDSSCNELSLVTDGPNTVPLLLVVTPIGVGGKFSIKGTTDFPVQGKEITSTGESGQEGDVAGNVKSRVRVTEKYEIPSFMLETLVAGINVGY